MSAALAPYMASTRPVAIVLHTAAIASLGCSVVRIFRKRQLRGWTTFWTLVLLTCLALMVTSAFEIAYAAISWTGFKIPYTPVHSFSGDLFCRLGMLGMTTARLYRLMLSVERAYVRRTLIVQVLTTIGLLISLSVTMWLRINEYAHMDPITGNIATDPGLQSVRSTESLVTFVVFIFVIAVSLGSDIMFNVAVISSARDVGFPRKQKVKDALVYLPSAFFNAAYLVIVCWARVIAQTDYITWRTLQYFAITYACCYTF
ncbi:hypothetical protein BC828DRAFT_383593 [Blastocladiella britannica]|nr:hypothetical protein BC828DRAFT_383593 [Blastocladiella britannica]